MFRVFFWHIVYHKQLARSQEVSTEKYKAVLHVVVERFNGREQSCGCYLPVRKNSY